MPVSLWACRSANMQPMPRQVRTQAPSAHWHYLGVGIIWVLADTHGKSCAIISPLCALVCRCAAAACKELASRTMSSARALQAGGSLPSLRPQDCSATQHCSPQFWHQGQSPSLQCQRRWKHGHKKKSCAPITMPHALRVIRISWHS